MTWALGARVGALGAAAALISAQPAAAVSCTLSGTAVAFGSYNAVTKAEVDTNGTITLTCTGSGSINYTVSLSAGQSGNELSRYMLNGSSRLAYQVYKDSAHTEVFGDGAGGTATFTNSWSVPAGTSARQGPIYGAIAASQNPVPGSFSDTVTLLVSY